MGIWREALEDAHEKSEGDLQARVWLDILAPECGRLYSTTG